MFEPARKSTVLVTPPALRSTEDAAIAPPAVCVTPPSIVERSTVAPVSTLAAPSAIPPEPAFSTKDVVAPTLPVTAIVPVFAPVALSEIETFAAVAAPDTVRTPVLPSSTNEKSPDETANAPSVPTLFAVLVSAVAPDAPDPLRKVVATILPPAVCPIVPPPVVETSTVAPDTVLAAPSDSPPAPAISVTRVVAPTLPDTPIAGPSTEIVPAVSFPARSTEPVFFSRKSPDVAANVPTETIVFEPARRSTVLVTPPALRSTVLADTTPAAAWVTPLPVADRSIVAPVRIWPEFSWIPPVLASSTSADTSA